jgi:uncharacterized protein (TIGR02588 family)
VTKLHPPHSSIDSREGSLPHRPPQGVRKLAEWVSFGVSALIVVALAAYLVYDGLRTNGPIVPIEVTVAIDEAARAEARYVVPVKVRNNGRRTLTDVKVRVTHRSGGGEARSEDFDIDYLPEDAQETVYVFVDRDPREAQVEARALQYRLE